MIFVGRKVEFQKELNFWYLSVLDPQIFELYFFVDKKSGGGF